ncbi:MAG: cation:proton antiporter [Nakamurella sp.]
MTFTVLAIILVASLLGPLLALPRRWRLPVVLGELIAGLILGRSGFGVLDATDPQFTALADIGFGLVMFVAGTHVPVRDARLRADLGPGALRAGAVGLVGVPLGLGLAALSGTGHGALYAVLIASSSAALILPAVESLKLEGPPVLALLPQIAIADTACIVALPLVINPAHAGRAAVGAALVIGTGGLLYLVLATLDRRGVRRRLHRLSAQRRYALELRINLILLCGLAALALWGHVSIMLAGFVLGLAIAAVGEPHRLARQMFGITQGLFGPVFFVWLGSSLALGDLVDHPKLALLGLALGLAAVAAHLLPSLWGQPGPYGLLAAAQLGVPVAAATVGDQLGVLVPGESSALILGSLITLAATTLGGSRAARTQERDAQPA